MFKLCLEAWAAQFPEAGLSPHDVDQRLAEGREVIADKLREVRAELRMMLLTRFYAGGAP